MNGMNAQDLIPYGLVRPKKACQMLHCTPRIMEELRSSGILPFTRIGPHLYFRVADILVLIAKGNSKNQV